MAYFDGEVNIKMKGNHDLFATLSQHNLESADYDPKDYEKRELADEVIISGEEHSRVFRKIDSGFYDAELLIIKEKDLLGDMLKYIEEETKYTTPYTDFEKEGKFKANLRTEFEEYIANELDSLEGSFNKTSKNKVLEIVKESMSGGMIATVGVKKFGWRLEDVGLDEESSSILESFI